MKLVPMIDLIKDAQNKLQGVAAINVSNLETIKSVLEASCMAGYPVILQVAPIQLKLENISYYEIVEIAKILGEKYDIETSVHLDHAETVQQCFEAIDCGFTSVMYDGSSKPFEVNIRNTKKVVEYAREKNVTVEGELGRVGGAEASTEDIEALMTNPDEAEYYVKSTGVDCLAVSIGNAHGEYKLEPKLNFQLLENIYKKVNIPLVLHGGTGIPDDHIKKAITLGIGKVNFFTEIDREFVKGFINAYEKDHNSYMMACANEASKKMIKKALDKINLCKVN